MSDTLVSEVFNSFDEEHDKSYKKLILIASALNEGWEPNWLDLNENKYYPYFRTTSSGFGFSGTFYGCEYTNTICGSRLCFKTRELAEYAGRQFESIYKDYLTIEE